jgi:hypothetical protein
MITMVALAKRFRIRFAMEGLDRLSNTRCSHARSANIRMITATPSVYKPARQQLLVLTRRNTSCIPKNFLYFTTSNTVRHHNPTSHILWLISPVIRLQRLHTRGRNPCQFPISKVLYARRSVDLCIDCTPLSSESRVDSCGGRRTVRLWPIDLSLARSACLQKSY